MKKILILFLLFVGACNTNKLETNLKNDFIFSENMTFEDFKKKVKNYAQQSTYPNIDN